MDKMVVFHHRCQLCRYFTKSSFFLTYHMKCHHKIEAFNCAKASLGTYHCHDCNFKTKLLKRLNHHIEARHKKSPNLKKLRLSKKQSCTNCSFKTYSTLHLLKHSIECVESRNQWFECSECDFKTVWKHNLEQHKTSHHEEVKLMNWFFKCVECSYMTRVKAELDQHRKEHQPKYGFECKQCHLVEESQQMLDRHLAVAHLDEDEWFTCPCCPYKVTMELSLRKHIKTWHLTK